MEDPMPKNAILAAIMSMAAVFSCGCLSVVRIPLPLEQYDREGNVTNMVWVSFCDEVKGMRVYPTVKMRIMVTYSAYFEPIPEDLPEKKRVEMVRFRYIAWLPLLAIWITAPVDAAVDTIFLPYDIYVKRRKETEASQTKRRWSSQKTGFMPSERMGMGVFENHNRRMHAKRSNEETWMGLIFL